jgi:hypothetical protein
VTEIARGSLDEQLEELGAQLDWVRAPEVSEILALPVDHVYKLAREERSRTCDSGASCGSGPRRSSAGSRNRSEAMGEACKERGRPAARI